MTTSVLNTVLLRSAHLKQHQFQVVCGCFLKASRAERRLPSTHLFLQASRQVEKSQQCRYRKDVICYTIIFRNKMPQSTGLNDAEHVC